MSSTILLIFVFSLYNVVTTELSLYQEMKNLDASCFPLDSCRKFWYSTGDHLWNERKCECGYHCVRFGTCCADSAYVSQKFYLPLSEHESCQKLENFPNSIMMISQCDSNNEWPPDIIEKCEKSNHSSRDRLLNNIPLTNVKTLSTYKNFFCALCNYGGKDFLFWNIDLETKARQKLVKNLVRFGKHYLFKTLKYDTSNNNWTFLDKKSNKRFKIKFQYILPTYLLKTVKPCYVSSVQTCKSSYAKSATEEKCQAYYSPISIKQIVYKNIHCAICNDVETSFLTINSCMKKTSKRAEKYRASFGILVDVNTQKGNKVGMTEVPGPDCGVNAVYDSFANKCRKVVCLPVTGRVLVNGKCVPK